MPVSKSLKDRAYQHIQAKLLAGTTGEMVLSDRALAEEMGISRTPVREAFRHLESAGLISRRSRSGSSVNVPSRQEIEEAYDLRLMIEAYAVGRAARVISNAHIRKLEAQNRLLLEIHKKHRDAFGGAGSQSEGEVSTADMAFHLMILRGAGCSQAVRFAENLHILTKLARPGNWGFRENLLHRAATAVREHHHIIRALRRGDAEVACSVMVRHIERAKAVRLASLDAAGSPNSPNSPGEPDADPVQDARRVLRHTGVIPSNRSE